MAKKSGQKNSLVANINKRKKAGKSRTKKQSTISKEAYNEMQKGWPASKKQGTKSSKAPAKKSKAPKKKKAARKKSS